MPFISGGGGGGGFNGGTITTGLNVEHTYLDIYNATNDIALVDGSIGATQPIQLNFSDGASAFITDEAAANHKVLLGNTASALVYVAASGSSLGFFGHAPVTQPAHPANITDVIAALTALGLTA
jgi:hypothetical protein